ncbi:MAG: pseudouridine synthase, partial [Salinisphaera sp.]|nr:pseudouridine synthase [Salinisphaera sp.]
MSIPDTSTDVRRLVIPSDFRGQRLDKVLAQLLPDYSRARLQAWLKAGAIEVDGVAVAPRTAVRGGEQLHARLGIVADAVSITAQAIPLELVYEDAAILVVHKPAGLVMHPGAGNPNGTLQNALLHHDPGLGAVPRAGIVHRLDKDTSGLLVVARNLCAHKHLVAALAARSIQREYEAVVCGALIAGGTVDAPIGRHPADRKRMAVRAHVGPGARAARTHYRVLQRFAAH